MKNTAKATQTIATHEVFNNLIATHFPGVIETPAFLRRDMPQLAIAWQTIAAAVGVENVGDIKTIVARVTANAETLRDTTCRCGALIPRNSMARDMCDPCYDHYTDVEPWD
jgi:hypothetical protein